MSFPTALSPSPVHEAFAGIPWDPLEKLDLSHAEKALLRAAEDNPLDYTLADQADAEAYTFALLKVLDLALTPVRSSPQRSNSNTVLRSVSKLSLEQCLPDDEALSLLYVDSTGVVLHYAIAKLSEVIINLSSNNGRKKSMHKKVTLASTFYPSGTLVEHWRPLWRMLSGSLSDPFAQRGAAFCLACILLEGDNNNNNERHYCSIKIPHSTSSSSSTILESFVSWMTSRLQQQTHQPLSIVTPSLIVLMKSPQARRIFDAAGGVGYLLWHLRTRDHHHHNNNDHRAALHVQYQPQSRSSSTGSTGKNDGSVQQLYELTYCLWLLSYDCRHNALLRKHFYRDGAVPHLCDLVVAAPREKVLRLALSTLRNLATTTTTTTTTRNEHYNNNDDDDDDDSWGGHVFRREMVGCGLLKSVNRLLLARTTTRWQNDPDILDDLQVLQEALRDTFSHMTRWDVYDQQVESSHLQWGILHTTKFFQENVRRMEGSDGKFGIVRRLIQLAASEDEEVAAIACFDLGEFARHYPNGRSIARRLGARDMVIGLIEHPHPELQHQALVAISKMLVLHWDVSEPQC